jgi:hypothetical protein
MPDLGLVSELRRFYVFYMAHRLASTAAALAVAVAGVLAACGPDTTSFRTTDRTVDNRMGPPAAAYDVYLSGQLSARVHVWSNGGYVSSGDEPMTHIGFEVASATMRPLTFDADALELTVFDGDGQTLPRPRFTSITPLGPTLVTVPPASTVMLGAYFALPVRPRGVESMQVKWLLRRDTEEYREVTGFIRDDDAPIVDRVRAPEAPATRAPNS